MTKLVRLFPGIVRIIVVGILFATPKLFAQSVHGVFRVVKGDVKVTAASDGKTAQAKIGQKVYPLDTVVTGKDSRAKIVMVDNNEINISPDSKIKIDEYKFNPSSGEKKVSLKIEYGKMRAKVNQKYDDDENTFQVKTQTAVAGVRGTDFFTSFDRGTRATKVVTFEGRVAFGQPGVGGAISNPVMVNPGQMTTVTAGAPPAPPVSVPKAELANMESQSVADPADAAAKGSTSREPSQDKSEKTEKSEGDGQKEAGDKKPEAKAEEKSENKTEKQADNKADGKAEPKSEGKSENKQQTSNDGGAKGDGAKSPGSSGGGGDRAPASAAGGPGGAGAPGGAAGNEGGSTAAAGPKGGPGGKEGPNAAGPKGGPMTGGPKVGPPGPGGPNAGPMPGSMLTGNDLGTGPKAIAPPPMMNMPLMPIVNLPPPPPPVCDFCNSLIQTKPTKLIFIINQ
jgi:hypothetical protein